jgi:acyl carrier protein
VLSPEGRLCGVGERGEIAIRTPFRTLGYMNGEEEQRRRFAVNPFRSDKADLIYYTGDLGRYGNDGTLEILGRRDDQLKVRGVRIEPGEVEGALRSLAGVRQVVVDARELQPGQKALVAYVVAAAEGRPSGSEMRRHLRARLPESMIPTAFVLLDSLPLTSNGKVDRRALPEPAAAVEDMAAYQAPRTPVEELLCGLWREVLGVGRVGVHDNFFDLGGHSLLATRIVSRVKETFRVTPPLRLLFEEPTVEALAAQAGGGG